MLKVAQMCLLLEIPFGLAGPKIISIIANKSALEFAIIVSAKKMNYREVAFREIQGRVFTFEHLISLNRNRLFPLVCPNWSELVGPIGLDSPPHLFLCGRSKALIATDIHRIFIYTQILLNTIETQIQMPIEIQILLTLPHVC